MGSRQGGGRDNYYRKNQLHTLDENPKENLISIVDENLIWVLVKGTDKVLVQLWDENLIRVLVKKEGWISLTNKFFPPPSTDEVPNENLFLVTSEIGMRISFGFSSRESGDFTHFKKFSAP